MQGVMTIDLTKILSDKVYTLKSSLSDKPKIKRVPYSYCSRSNKLLYADIWKFETTIED